MLTIEAVIIFDEKSLGHDLSTPTIQTGPKTIGGCGVYNYNFVRVLD